MASYARIHGNTGFNPLPKEEFGHGTDPELHGRKPKRWGDL